MYFRDTIVAGKTIMRFLKATARVKTERQERAPRKYPTSEAVQKNNFRYAVRMLTAKLNHNFKPGDYHVTLTYKDLVSTEEAKKNLKRFLDNMRNYCRKNNIEFKWVAVTEYEHTRIHHHIVMSKVDLEAVKKYWPHGYRYPSFLDDTGNYYRLAEYLLKETEKTFREDGSPQKRRYTSSRNVKMPEVRREKVSGREVDQYIKVPAGYYVDEDTKRKYKHAILGVECMEYILVSTEDEPRIKRWRKGRAVNPRESFKDYERQIDMAEMYDLEF